MSKTYLIVLAEDDEDDQELITMAFAQVTRDHTLQITSNGQELLDALDQEKNLPCLIILDLNMPVLNGFQTLSILNNNAKFRRIPKIILTTSDTDDNRRKSLSTGAVDYFVKPSNMKDFILTARKILSYCQ